MHLFIVGYYSEFTELFNVSYVEKAIKKSKILPPSVFDLLATLTRFSAETIAEAILNLFKQKQLSKASIQQFKVYMSGGGMHNPLLVKYLKELLPDLAFKKTDDLGINGDAKEAVLFAILANECVAGGVTNFGSREGVPIVSMGKISFPN